MTEKLRKWTSDESEKMCDSFWKLEPESQVRIYILALAEKIHSIMQERGSELGLDNQEIALGQKILGYLKDNNQHLACAYIDTVPKGSVLKKYITGIQRRGANLMEPRRTLSDKKIMLGIDHTTVSEIQILLRERFFLKMNQMNRYFFTDFFLKIAISR